MLNLVERKYSKFKEEAYNEFPLDFIKEFYLIACLLLRDYLYPTIAKREMFYL